MLPRDVSYKCKWCIMVVCTLIDINWLLYYRNHGERPPCSITWDLAWEHEVCGSKGAIFGKPQSLCHLGPHLDLTWQCHQRCNNEQEGNKQGKACACIRRKTPQPMDSNLSATQEAGSSCANHNCHGNSAVQVIGEGYCESVQYVMAKNMALVHVKVVTGRASTRAWCLQVFVFFNPILLC